MFLCKYINRSYIYNINVIGHIYHFVGQEKCARIFQMLQLTGTKSSVPHCVLNKNTKDVHYIYVEHVAQLVKLISLVNLNIASP